MELNTVTFKKMLFLTNKLYQIISNTDFIPIYIHSTRILCTTSLSNINFFNVSYEDSKHLKIQNKLFLYENSKLFVYIITSISNILMSYLKTFQLISFCFKFDSYYFKIKKQFLMKKTLLSLLLGTLKKKIQS